MVIGDGVVISGSQDSDGDDDDDGREDGDSSYGDQGNY